MSDNEAEPEQTVSLLPDGNVIEGVPEIAEDDEENVQFSAMGAGSTQDTPFIPPETVHFRIYNPTYDHHLYCNRRNGHQVLVTKNGNATQDQWVTIHPNDDGRTYSLQAEMENQWICTNSRGAGHALQFSDVRGSATTFELQWGQGTRSGQFKMHFTQLDCYAMISGDYVIKAVPADVLRQVNDGSEWFQYWFEDMDLIDMRYELDSARIFDGKPMTLVSGMFNDSGNGQMTYSFACKKTIKNSAHWDFNYNYSLKTTATATAGVPAIVGAKAQISSEHNVDFKFGKSTETSQTYDHTMTYQLQSNSQVRITAAVTESNLDIPFVAVFRAGQCPDNIEVRGMYHGVSTSDFHVRCEVLSGGIYNQGWA